INNGVPAVGYVAGKPLPSDPRSQDYQNRLMQAAVQLGIESNIIFLNRFLSDEEVTEYLRAADLVIMNYQAQHYEASGACSLAVGAGALVATSLAPAFMSFGDAVWHMTAGYPADLSADLLLRNRELADEVRRCADQYCAEHA